MESCQTASFHAAIAPLERAYGLYAHPNNYEFERMNAGVIKALNSHYPSVALLDDSVRSSVYEHLHTSAHRTPSRDVVLETVTAAIRNPLLPLPALREWTPNEFVKLQQSKGADQLREVLRQLKTSEPKDIQRWLDQALASARALDPAENVVYAFAGFGASVLSAVQAAANPYFFIPSVVFAAIGVDQVWNTIDDTIKASEFSWLKVAKTIATWAPPEMRESIDARNA
jgi:hypothetical protein